MTTNKYIDLLNGNELDAQFEYLYKSNIDEQKSRYIETIGKYSKVFGDNNDIFLISAPGRTELCGNHTDHQHGRVLAAAVTMDMLAVVSKRDDGKINIKSEGYPQFSLNSTENQFNKDEVGTTTALMRGALYSFEDRGYSIGGFDAYITSIVPKGSGLSSSAATEILFGAILNYLYNDGKIEPVELAIIGQYVENNFFGKPSGLMDQMAAAVGSAVFIDFADIIKPNVKSAPCDFVSSGYELFIINAGGSHANLTDEYAAVPEEMKSVARALGGNLLNDIPPETFFSSMGSLRKKVSDRSILRAIHFYEENERVDLFLEALESNDIEAVKSVMLASGLSSSQKLQNIYPSADTDERSVALALTLCERLLRGKGAWRVHGGGFAGTVQALVPLDMCESFKAEVEAIFGNDTAYITKIRPTGAYMFS